MEVVRGTGCRKGRGGGRHEERSKGVVKRRGERYGVLCESG